VGSGLVAAAVGSAGRHRRGVALSTGLSGLPSGNALVGRDGLCGEQRKGEAGWADSRVLLGFSPGLYRE
jgi:hypothetical protein